MPELTAIPASVWGSLPGWGLFIVVLGYLGREWLKNQPIQQKQTIEERLAIKGGYTARITELEQAIENERKNCARELSLLRDEIGDLQSTMMGMQRQHTQEQISLINAIISSIDAPELKALVKSLETVQAMSRLSAHVPAANEAS